MRHIWVGCILLSTAIGGQAASLGRHSGAAVIGRPLDVRVQALLAPGEDLASLCAQSEVFYGDTQVSSSAVRVVPQKAAPDAEASLRVQSSVPVDEPVVTLYVRLGCSAPFSRRYVLLADPVTEPLAAAQTRAPTQFAVSSPVAPLSLPAAEAIASAPAAQPGAGASADQPLSAGAGVRAVPPSAGGAATPPARVTPRAPAPRSAARASEPASVVRRDARPATPRLELDPVDLSLSFDRDPVLKLSLSMLSEPAASDEERAAAARLWQAINASPEDILRDNQKLMVLESEAKGLRDQELRNQAAIERLESELEQSRHLRWLIYALGAALLLTLLTLFYFWRQRRVAEPSDAAERAWWAAANAEKEMAAGTAVPTGQGGARALDLDLDLDLGMGKPSAMDSMRPLDGRDLEADSTPGLLAADKREFAASQIGVSRSVATEELFDVQQQADFFMSLGEYQQAVEVLRSHLAESQEPSPLAYLDLLKIYHKLGRRDDYQRLREDFNRLFNAGAPSFEHYSDEGRGLEHYGMALSRIQALWPEPRVLDVIESSIFREESDPEAEVFDLEAYRELLLLHAIAKDVITRANAKRNSGTDFEHTAIKPLKAAGSAALAAAVAERAMAGRETQPLDEIPLPSPRLGLDVDLDELSEISAFEASLPEVSVPVEPSAKPLTPPGRAADEDLGNLIDFEVLDFVPPEPEVPAPDKKKP